MHTVHTSVRSHNGADRERACREFRELETASARVCAAAGIRGVVARRVAQALACYAWPRAHSSRVNANSRLQALSTAWIIETIYQATGQRYARRNVAGALNRLADVGVLAVTCRLGKRGRIDSLRVAVHRSPDCIGRGVQAFDRRGQCRTCAASLLQSGESWPLGAAHGEMWQLFFGLPTGAERRRAYASRATSPLPLAAGRGSAALRAERDEAMRERRRQGASQAEIMADFGVSRHTVWRATRGVSPMLQTIPPMLQTIPAMLQTIPANEIAHIKDPTGGRTGRMNSDNSQKSDSDASDIPAGEQRAAIADVREAAERGFSRWAPRTARALDTCRSLSAAGNLSAAAVLEIFERRQTATLGKEREHDRLRM